MGLEQQMVVVEIARICPHLFASRDMYRERGGIMPHGTKWSIQHDQTVPICKVEIVCQFSNNLK
jgi:hypothetical protein